MIFGVLLAWALFPGMSIWLLSLMALILSPTDAALGQAVVKSNSVPEPIRQAINVESGLNDGIALPPILLCIAVLAGDPARQLGSGFWSDFIFSQLIHGPVIGAAVGLVGGFLVDRASRAGWMNDTFQRLVSVSLAMIAYAAAEMFHGNGFIAAYFGGLLLGVRSHAVRERVQEFGEAEGQQLALYIFLLFGLVLVPAVITYWDIRAWVYAVMSLTLIRMLPVALSLIGSRLDWASVGFIGWFGTPGHRLGSLPAYGGWKAGNSKPGIPAWRYRFDRDAERPGPRIDRRPAVRRLWAISVEKKQGSRHCMKKWFQNLAIDSNCVLRISNL